MIDLTPVDVRKKKGDFRRAMRGYEPALVDDFLDQVADRMDELVREGLALKDRVARQEQQIAEFRERERALTEALVTAQEMREEIRQQTSREAELMKQTAEQHAAQLRAATTHELTQLRAAAEQEAARIRASAEQEAASLRAVAERESAELSGTVRQQREREEEELRRLRIRQEQFIATYRALLERELDELSVVARAVSPAAREAEPGGPGPGQVAAPGPATAAGDAAPGAAAGFAAGLAGVAAAADASSTTAASPGGTGAGVASQDAHARASRGAAPAKAAAPDVAATDAATDAAPRRESAPDALPSLVTRGVQTEPPGAAGSGAAREAGDIGATARNEPPVSLAGALGAAEPAEADDSSHWLPREAGEPPAEPEDLGLVVLEEFEEIASFEEEPPEPFAPEPYEPEEAPPAEARSAEIAAALHEEVASLSEPAPDALAFEALVAPEPDLDTMPAPGGTELYDGIAEDETDDGVPGPIGLTASGGPAAASSAHAADDESDDLASELLRNAAAAGYQLPDDEELLLEDMVLEEEPEQPARSGESDDDGWVRNLLEDEQ